MGDDPNGARPRWSRFAHRHAGDALAMAFLTAAAVVLTLVTAIPATSFMRGDWPTFFFPMYTHLGARLRAFDVPGWNPHQFSGMPFAGDPESGWGYIPAMLLYGVLPAEPATVVFIGGHIVFAGLAMYLLARLLVLDRAGSFVAGSAFALAWVATASSQMVLAIQVAIWLIVCLFGVECALRASTWSRRIRGWLIGGIGISQILAAWVGQGAYYALLVIGSWVVFRALIGARPDDAPAARPRDGLINGIGVMGAGLALSAATLLPRLDVVGRSNLAGAIYTGRSAWSDRQTGYTPAQLVEEVLGGFSGSLWWYAGAAATALALAAPIVAWRWRPLPFFSLLAMGSLVLALAQQTPLHAGLYAALPFFARFHEHSPERILMLYPPAIALLAGATVSSLAAWKGSPFVLLAAAAVPAGVAVAASLSPMATGLLSRQSTVIMVGVAILIAAATVARTPIPRLGMLVAVCALIVWDPAGRIVVRGFSDESHLEHSLPGSLTAVKDARRSAETTGALGSPSRAAQDFLHRNPPAAHIALATETNPGRYAGFAPWELDAIAPENRKPDLGYRNALKNPLVNRLLVFNWATWFGLEDVQGYNPVQVRRYVETIDALNGQAQEYHEANILPSGLTSPLLDLFNLRFVIVPAPSPSNPELDPLLAAWPRVYEDAHVRILERPAALPRAWIVHQARTVAPGQALSLLTTGSVDLRQTALLETTPPPMESPPPGARESARYLLSEPDVIAARVTAETPGLLVLSEVWDPGWTATVDGAAAPLYVANHVLRGIPIPAGQHIVELRYDPPLLRQGIAVTLLTLAILCSAAIATGRGVSPRAPRDGTRSTAGL